MTSVFEFNGVKYSVSTSRGFEGKILDFKKRKWKLASDQFMAGMSVGWWLQWHPEHMDWGDNNGGQQAEPNLEIYFGSRCFYSIFSHGQGLDHWTGKISWTAFMHLKMEKEERPDMPETFQLFFWMRRH